MWYKLEKIKSSVFFVTILMTLNCYSQQIQRDGGSNLNLGYEKFLCYFSDLQLPFEITKLDDFDKYTDKVIKDSNNKTTLVSNPIFPIIPKSEYLYIKGINIVDKKYEYRGIYKKTTKHYVFLIIKQTDRETEDFFFILNLYDFKGNLLDSITIAGMKIDDYDLFCKIDSHLNIRIRKTINLTPTLLDNSLGTESMSDYIITDDGHFKSIFNHQRKGKYILQDGGSIVIK